ncbi:Ff.00g037870.m01.CDS01 [Fusarium sp. VM40]|nr:Ff.00g037870.m01.CDS01 [Fusarium sp. VM40]
MTSQTPSSLGTNVMKGQRDASSRINDVVITPEMTPDVINMLLKRFKFDVIPEKVLPKKAPDNSGKFAAVVKLQSKLRVLKRFPDQRPRQSATPEQQKAGQYLAEQREACKQMLEMEMIERWR